MKYRVLIADDEPPARERLLQLFSPHQNFEIVKICKDADEVENELLTNRIDLAVLDINMPGKNIFVVVSSLQRLSENTGNTPLIVFQTAYREFAVDAFNIEALDYLLKPVSADRFSSMIEKATAKLSDKLRDSKNEKLSFITVEEGTTKRLIHTDKLKMIIYEDGFCFAYEQDERYLAPGFLNYYESILDEKFFRVSRDAIVNLNFVESLSPLGNGNFKINISNSNRSVELTRRRAKEFKKVINI